MWSFYLIEFSIKTLLIKPCHWLHHLALILIRRIVMIGPVLYLCCTLSLSNYANVCFIESSSSRSGLFSWACAPLDWFFHLGILKKLYHLINFLFPLRQCLGCTVHGRMLVYDILHGIDTYHCYYRMRYWWPRHWYPGLNRMCRLTTWDRFPIGSQGDQSSLPHKRHTGILLYVQLHKIFCGIYITPLLIILRQQMIMLNPTRLLLGGIKHHTPQLNFINHSTPQTLIIDIHAHWHTCSPTHPPSTPWTRQAHAQSCPPRPFLNDTEVSTVHQRS